MEGWLFLFVIFFLVIRLIFFPSRSRQQHVNYTPKIQWRRWSFRFIYLLHGFPTEKNIDSNWHHTTRRGFRVFVYAHFRCTIYVYIYLAQTMFLCEFWHASCLYDVFICGNASLALYCTNQNLQNPYTRQLR